MNRIGLSTGLVLCVLVALGACSPPAATPSPAAVPTPPTSATEPPQPAAPVPAATGVPEAPPVLSNGPSGNLFDLILRSQKAQLAVPTLRSTMVTTLPNGSSVTTVVEYKAPDRVHLQSGANELIAIKGKGGWQRRGGEWVASPADMTDSVFNFVDPATIDRLSRQVAPESVKFVGSDTLNGLPMWMIEYSSVAKNSAPGGGDVNTKGKVWIGVNDGLPYKAEGTADAGADGTSKTSVIYEYNLDLKIEQPIP